MYISIFTVGSLTTAEDEGETAEVMREYFRGLFSPMAPFAERLEEFGTVDLHILSDEFGYVTGDEPVEEVESRTLEDTDKMRAELKEASRSSDVVVLAFMNEQYTSVVQPIRDKVFENAYEGQIWGFSASGNVRSWLKPEEFEDKGCKVVVYDKIGPYIMGTDARDEIVELVEEDRFETQ